MEHTELGCRLVSLTPGEYFRQWQRLSSAHRAGCGRRRLGCPTPKEAASGQGTIEGVTERVEVGNVFKVS